MSTVLSPSQKLEDSGFHDASEHNEDREDPALFTAEEERRVVRKIDMVIMPLVSLHCHFALLKTIEAHKLQMCFTYFVQCMYSMYA